MGNPPTRRRRTLLTSVILAAVLVATSCTATPPTPTADASAVATPGAADVFAASITIAPGRTLWVECQGVGTPTVILESGIHDSSDAWITLALASPAVGPNVFDALAEVTRVCRYDRPGTILVADEPVLTDRSSPVEMPRSIEDAAKDLDALIQAAELEPPYLLVGHSFGGFLQTYFAQTRPAEVAGLVLVDAFSADMPALFGDQWSAYERVLNGGPEPLASDPDFERWDIDAGVALALGAPPPRQDLPVIVISKTEPFALPADVEGFGADDLERVWAASQASLVSLVPGTTHVLAGSSDHLVQAREPDLVTQAIVVAIERIRRGALTD